MKIFLLGLVIIMSPYLYGEEVKPTEATKGCVMKGCALDGSPINKYFVKVADSEQDDADTGEPQIWGYDPLDKIFDRQGHIIFERVIKKDFIRRGAAGRKEGQPCVFKCPLW